MEERSNRLAEYVTERVGDGVRAVGYHTPESFEVVYIRDDVAATYPADRVDRFMGVSRAIHDAINDLEAMGEPVASLHSLDDGLIIQFHVAVGEVVFLALDHDLGRDFGGFVDDCKAAMA